MASERKITGTENVIAERNLYTQEQVDAAIEVLLDKIPVNMPISMQPLPGGHVRVMVHAPDTAHRRRLIDATANEPGGA